MMKKKKIMNNKKNNKRVQKNKSNNKSKMIKNKINRIMN